MATYRVALGGSNTAPYDTWAKAATSYATAVAAATADGDVIWVDKDFTEEVAGDTTYTYAAHAAVICVDKDASDALAVMGTAAWIGNSTTNRSVTLAGAKKVFHYGITFRTAGTTNDTINVASTDGAHHEFESCYLWQGNTNSSGFIRLGGTNDSQAYVKLKNCTLRFGNASQFLQVSANVEVEGGSASSAGSIPTSFILFNATDPGGGRITFEGFDASALAGGNLVGDATTLAGTAIFTNCKLGTNYVPLATQSTGNRSGAEVWLFNCADADFNVMLHHVNPLGSTIINVNKYFTASPAGVSWQIATTANASFYAPYVSPWIELYNSTLSALTPYLEFARSGSATAFKDDEVWGEFSYQGTSGFPMSVMVNDRMALLGSNANQDAGAGTGSWTGLAGTAWSGKLSPTSSITPAEVGPLKARLVAGVASQIIYLDPYIRT